MKISVVIPIHNMQNLDFFLGRLMQSLQIQTYRDFEIVITKDGKMAENTNAGIKKATGEIIKIMYADDYLAHPDSLKNIAENFKGGWLATGCIHDWGDGELINPHEARIDGILKSSSFTNTIGSPSVIAVENKDPLLFDENMTWVLDIDYYDRLYKRYGLPTILDSYDVVMGCGDHQITHIMSEEDKKKEEKYFINKYGKS
ncbi:MAG: glycosyltransferase family A protein [Nanoarchaeota archaeon]